MSTLDLIALAAFVCVFFALVVDTLRSVGRPPVWDRPRARLDMPLAPDRRHRQLSFVGRDRRAAAPVADRPAQAPSRKVA